MRFFLFLRITGVRDNGGASIRMLNASGANFQLQILARSEKGNERGARILFEFFSLITMLIEHFLPRTVSLSADSILIAAQNTLPTGRL